MELRRNREAQIVAEAQLASTAETVAQNSADPYGLSSMEVIPKYSGVGGGGARRVFIQDSNKVYERMSNTPAEHVLNSFGQLEFLGLLATRLTGEARTVFSSHMEEWNHRNENNPNHAAAVEAEAIRQLWRDWRRDNTAFRVQGLNSGFTVAPLQPEVPEPRDLERFFDALEARFQSSTLDNLGLIQRFTPEENVSVSI